MTLRCRALELMPYATKPLLPWILISDYCFCTGKGLHLVIHPVFLSSAGTSHVTLRVADTILPIRDEKISMWNHLYETQKCHRPILRLA